MSLLAVRSGRKVAVSHEGLLTVMEQLRHVTPVTHLSYAPSPPAMVHREKLLTFVSLGTLAITMYK